MAEQANKIAEDKNLAIAIKRLNMLQRQACFSPYDFASRPTVQQQQVLDDIVTYQHRYVLGGNQCKPAGSLILTPKGPVAIESIRVGDTVYDEDGKEIEVVQVYKNGVKSVVELLHRGVIWGESTLNHVWLTDNSSKRKGPRELPVEAFVRDTQILRTVVKAPLGSVKVPYAYALGAILGDGCCTCGSSNRLVVSGKDEEIINKIATQLKGSYKKQGGTNFNWTVNINNTYELIDKWCIGKLAHEKKVDVEYIKTWDRASLLSYVAGLVDTDGSIFVDSFDTIIIQIGMQAKSVIESLQYAFLALWQVPVMISIDNRDKYKNGDVYTLKVSNNAYSKYILNELDSELVVPRKKFKPEYINKVAKRTSPNAVGVKLGNTREVETYDITVNSKRNLYLTATGLITHNSGKSQTGGRECAWMLSETHPTFVRPAQWKNMPLTMIIVGRTTAQVEELWNKKIKPFLDVGDLREIRSGGQLTKVVHRLTGNYILFFSHHSPEEAREKIQSFDAHWLWLDEMPDSFKLLEELHRRCMAWSGRFLATFTPKLRNNEIRNIVDNITPYQKTYRIGTLENPMYIGREAEVLAPLERMPEGYRNMILTGSWYTGDLAVYQFDTTHHCRPIPDDYNFSWRHVEAIDPAASSKAGYCLLAEHPITKVWHIITADYIAGSSAKNLLIEMERRRKDVRIVKRVSDPHEAWFIKHAHDEGLTFTGVYKKSERKKELIKNLQHALDSKRISVNAGLHDLINEFATCQWSENGDDRIIGSRRFHILDALQYAVDNLPAPEKTEELLTYNQWLRKANRERKIAEEKEKSHKNKPVFGRIVARQGRMIRNV